VFAVQAFDRSGQYSALSNEVSAIGRPAAPAVNRQGLWWNRPAGSEPGWGINLAHQADAIFATLFTYDADGGAWWLSMTARPAGAGVYAGALYETRAPGPEAGSFDPAHVVHTPVGYGTLAFNGPDMGTFSYVIGTVTETRDIVRQQFGPLPVCTFASLPDPSLATNFQDLWWNSPPGSESGWGLNIAHQGDKVFATWFTHDADHHPFWLSVNASNVGPGVYYGDLERTIGPPYDAPAFDPDLVRRMKVGTATLTFANGNDAIFEYSYWPADQVGPVVGTKRITRQIFAPPGTTCQ
jgi:hypothetical protein